MDLLKTNSEKSTAKKRLQKKKYLKSEKPRVKKSISNLTKSFKCIPKSPQYKLFKKLQCQTYIKRGEKSIKIPKSKSKLRSRSDLKDNEIERSLTSRRKILQRKSLNGILIKNSTVKLLSNSKSAALELTGKSIQKSLWISNKTGILKQKSTRPTVKKSNLRLTKVTTKQQSSLTKIKLNLNNRNDCLKLMQLLRKRITPWTKNADQQHPEPKKRLKRKKFIKSKQIQKQECKKSTTPTIEIKTDSQECLKEKAQVDDNKEEIKESKDEEKLFKKLSSDDDCGNTAEGLEPDDLEDLNDELQFIYKDSNTLYHSYGQILTSLMNMQQKRQRKGQMAPVVKTKPPITLDVPDTVVNRDFVQMMLLKKDVNYSVKYSLDLFQKEEASSDATFKALFREIEDIYSAGESFRACFDKEGYIHMKEYVRRKFKITKSQYEIIFNVAKNLREQVNKILEAYSGTLLDMFRMTDSDLSLSSYKDNDKKASQLKIYSFNKDSKAISPELKSNITQKSEIKQKSDSMKQISVKKVITKSNNKPIESIKNSKKTKTIKKSHCSSIDTDKVKIKSVKISEINQKVNKSPNVTQTQESTSESKTSLLKMGENQIENGTEKQSSIVMKSKEREEAIAISDKKSMQEIKFLSYKVTSTESNSSKLKSEKIDFDNNIKESESSSELNNLEKNQIRDKLSKEDNRSDLTSPYQNDTENLDSENNQMKENNQNTEIPVSKENELPENDNGEL